MAMSHTSSTVPDWAQLYHRSITGGDQTSPPPAMFGHVSDSTVVTTTSSLQTQTVSAAASAVGISNHSNIDGRVGKSARRRSRASRKAPTTLLNTDTANFRAMVQQFTGIPSGPVINFGYNENIRQATSVPPPYAHTHQSHYQIQQQQYQQAQQQGTTFTLGNNNSSNNSTNDSVFQALSDHRNGFEVSGSLFLDGLPGPNSTWQ